MLQCLSQAITSSSAVWRGFKPLTTKARGDLPGISSTQVGLQIDTAASPLRVESSGSECEPPPKTKGVALPAPVADDYAGAADVAGSGCTVTRKPCTDFSRHLNYR
jgi:hypothetical protein